MKKIMLLTVTMLAACTPGYETDTGFTAMPPELQDCSIVSLRSEHGSSLYVVRCPNSCTSTRWAKKHPTNSVVCED